MRDDDERLSPATPAGQMRHLLDGVSRLQGRRRTVARVVCGRVLVFGAVLLARIVVDAASGAFS